MVNPTRVQLNGISKTFRATVALSDVSLTIPGGAVHCLLGENGAGKSTLVKILSGVIAPDSGALLLDGLPYAPRSPLDARKSGIMMIHQELSIVPDLSVTENIFLGFEESRGGFMSAASMRRRAQQALTSLGHHDIAPDTHAGRLSISQRQVVEIARALVHKTKVIIFDEPTSSLSAHDVQRLFDVIGRLKEQGPAIIYISHFLEEVFQVGDTYSVLRDGAVVASGAMHTTSPDGLAGLLRGDAQITRANRSAAQAFGESLLEIEHLSVPPRIHRATLRVRRGEILGICGLIGSGRSELLRSIMGLEPIASGTIRTAHNTGPQSPSQRWRSGVGFSSEDRAAESLALDLSIAHNVLLSVLAGLPLQSHMSEGAAIARCANIAERFNIRCQSLLQPVRELSGGNQQKIALARLALHDAELLLLDEPTRGIDIRSKAQIYDLLRRLVAEPTAAGKQRAAIIVSSSFSELLAVCDAVALLHRGILSPPISVSELSEHQLILMASGSGASPEPVQRSGKQL